MSEPFFHATNKKIIQKTGERNTKYCIHKGWADLSNRYHICDRKNGSGFETELDRGSVLVMYNVATYQQRRLGTSSHGRKYRYH